MCEVYYREKRDKKEATDQTERTLFEIDSRTYQRSTIRFLHASPSLKLNRLSFLMEH